jgi:RHS repeat-associated protein
VARLSGRNAISEFTSYTWDDNGNLTNRGADSFAWDYEDRMTSATVGGTTTTFAYRGDGLRASRTTGGVTKSFTWDINAGLPVVLDDGAQYLYGAGLEAMKQSGSWFYYLADGLGSTMAIVNATGTVQNSYAYDVYGKPTVTGSLSNEFDFAGQQTDATGLQYLRARYMDPETGTFLSRDPLARFPGWVRHPLGYAGANPVNLTDPFGLDTAADIRSLLATIAALGALIPILMATDVGLPPIGGDGEDSDDTPTEEVEPEIELVGEYAELAKKIANGHGYDKHVKENGEFGDMTRQEYAEMIQQALQHGAVRELSDGRSAHYLEGADGVEVIVVVDPGNPDGGTGFKGTEKRFERLK